MGLRYVFPLLVAMVSGVLTIQPAAAETCRTVAHRAVSEAVEGILADVLKSNPELKAMDRQALLKTAADKLMTADRPDFKAYGYMIRLFYDGDEAARKQVAEAAAALKTEAERAHLFFVLGLNLIRAKTQKAALQGRDFLKQIRASGHVNFVSDGLWEELESCEIAS